MFKVWCEIAVKCFCVHPIPEQEAHLLSNTFENRLRSDKSDHTTPG